MRLISGGLACVLLGAVSMAVAEDPPADTTNNAAPATTAPAGSPAAPPAAPAPAAGATQSSVTVPATAMPSAAPEGDQAAKHFLAEGYKMQMRNGQKVFCRREEQLGSRLGGALNCNTAEELNQIETQAKDAIDRAAHQVGPYPKGN
jgi:hypothetical protein